MIAVMMLLVSASVVQAAGARQTKAGKNSVKIEWDKPSISNARLNYYKIAIGKSYDNPTKTYQVSPSATSYVISGLKTYNLYYVRVYYNYTSTYTSQTYENWYPLSVITAPGKVSGIDYDFYSNQNGFRIVWNAPSGDAYGAKYQCTMRDLNGKLMKTFKTSSRYGFFSNFAVRKVGKAKIRAYIEVNGKASYGAWATKNIIPQPKLSTDKKKSYISGGKMRLSWTKVTGATGYDIFVSLKKDSGYKKVASVKSTSTGATLSSFNGSSFKYNTTYYVKMRTKSKLGNSDLNYGVYLRTYYY